MSGNNLKVRIGMVMLLAAVGVMPVLAGSAVVGSVAGSKDATVGGQALAASTTLFSGDSLAVNEGVAVIAMGQGSRMVFGHQTRATFLREGEGVTVLLGAGNVSMYHPEAGTGLRVKAGEVTVEPAAGYKTQGEVAMLNGAVVVTTKEGLLKVEGNGPAMEVGKGKTITVKTAAAAGPQAAPAAGAPVSHISGAAVMGIAAAGAGGTASILSGVAMKRANDAKDEATAAATAATSAAASAAAGEAAAKAACQQVTSPNIPTACQ